MFKVCFSGGVEFKVEARNNGEAIKAGRALASKFHLILVSVTECEKE